MNSLRSTKETQSDEESAEYIAYESISRLKAERAEEASASQSNSLSGMVAEAAYDPQQEGPFTTVCELASGGTATVYLAVDQRASAGQNLVAVKHYLPRLLQRRDFGERFVEEMSVVRAVDHPCVCKLLDYGRTGTSYYAATEFLQGEPLSNVLAAAGMQSLEQRPPRLIAHLIANLAEGLHAVHSLCTSDGPVDAVHQEVTPSNLFVLFDGSVRVTNFGSAWMRDFLGRKQGTIDRSYLAPEQLERGTLDARADIWALGVVLWELLAGQKLFRSTPDRDTAAEVRAHRIVAPSEHHPGVTADLDRIVLKALARNPSKRYASARQFSIDLAEYLARSGGALAKSTVVEWLTRLLPNGAERVCGLVELANARTRLPHFQSPDDPTVSTSAYTSATEDESEPTTHIHPARLATATLRSPPNGFVPRPLETISFKEVPLTLRRPRRGSKPTWRATFVPLGTAFCVVLFGFFAGHAAFSRASADGHAKSAPALATQLAHALSTVAAQPAAAVTAPSPMAPEASPTIEIVARQPALGNQPVPSAGSAATSTASSVNATRPKATPRRTTVAGSEPRPAKKSATPERAASTIATQPGAVYLTTPGGGDVYESGRFLGHAPAEFALSPGWHTLLVKSGADNRAVTVQVPAGAAIIVTVPASRP